MTSAFGGQRSIQLSYGCLAASGRRLAKGRHGRQPPAPAPYLSAVSIGWKRPRPQVGPSIPPGRVTVIRSVEQSCDSEVL